jgi:hypothetical protein
MVDLVVDGAVSSARIAPRVEKPVVELLPYNIKEC